MWVEVGSVLPVVFLPVQRGRLVAGTLPDHRRQRLHPQQLCGSIRLHPGRRVGFIFSFLRAPLILWDEIVSLR